MSNETVFDIIIVGGGWSGVSSALGLEDHNKSTTNSPIKYLLLEGHSDRLGGRAYSVPHSWTEDGKERQTYLERGAQYIGENQTAIWNLVQDSIAKGLISKDDLVDGYAARLAYREQIMVFAGKRYVYDRDNCLFGIGGVPPDLGIWDLIGSLIFIQAIEAIEQSVNVLSPWDSPKFVTELDKITLEEWLNQFDLTPAAVSLMRISVEAVLSVEPKDISAFYFFWYCASNRGFLDLVNDENHGPQQYYLSSGFSKLIEKLAEPFKERIRYGSIVQSIDYSKAITEIRTTDGNIYRAKKVILAMSPASNGKIAYTPALPQDWQEILSQKMGTTLKSKLFYDKPWWRNIPEQLSPMNEDVPQYTGYSGATNAPVTWVMDYSLQGPPPQYQDQGMYALMTFTVGDQAIKLGPNPDTSFVEPFLSTAVTALFDDPRALSSSPGFIGSDHFMWSSETPLIPGGPNTVFQIGVLSGSGSAMDDLIDDKILFAGAELSRTPCEDRSTSYPSWVPKLETFGATGTYSDWRRSVGYMDGAINSGRYAAREMLYSLGVAQRPVGKEIIGWLEEAACSAITFAEDIFFNPSSPPVQASPAQVSAALESMIDSLYSSSAPKDIDWNSPDWNNAENKSLMQPWVTQKLVLALCTAGLLNPPPNQPSVSDPQDPSPGDRLKIIEYMAQMAKWAPSFLSACTAFVQAGYQASKSPGKINHQAQICNQLMALKSAEPFVPETPRVEGAALPPSNGRFFSVRAHLRSIT